MSDDSKDKERVILGLLSNGDVVSVPKAAYERAMQAAAWLKEKAE